MENASTGVLDKIKNAIQDVGIKQNNHMMYKTYTIAYDKMNKKWRFTVHQVKPTAYLILKVDSLKMDQHIGGKWLIHDTKRRRDSQLQSLKLPSRISYWSI